MCLYLVSSMTRAHDQMRALRRESAKRVPSRVRLITRILTRMGDSFDPLNGPLLYFSLKTFGMDFLSSHLEIQYNFHAVSVCFSFSISILRYANESIGFVLALVEMSKQAGVSQSMVVVVGCGWRVRRGVGACR